MLRSQQWPWKASWNHKTFAWIHMHYPYLRLNDFFFNDKQNKERHKLSHQEIQSKMEHEIWREEQWQN